jgi:hypothetical protein
MEFIACRVAYLLDLIARRLHRVAPEWSAVQGAFVTYHVGRSSRFDFWRDANAWTLEMGRWELVVDLR